MRTIPISDSHFKWLQQAAARRPGRSLAPETILSELLDEIIIAGSTATQTRGPDTNVGG